MRTCVSITEHRWIVGCVLAAAAVMAPVSVEPARANSSPNIVKAEPIDQAAGRAADQPKQVASADQKAKDPLADLAVSEKTKAHQERADRALAENGESRMGDDDDEDAPVKPAEKTLQATAAGKPKALKAGIQCLAGCD